MHRVKFNLYKDEELNRTGFVPAAAFAEEYNAGFDPFYGGIQMFHDVFEHWFEGLDPHFRGDYSFIVSGEIVAQAACAYYYYVMGVQSRGNDGTGRFMDALIDETLEWVLEATNHSNTHYGDELLSCVPRISISNSYLDNLIDTWWITYKAGLNKDSTPVARKYAASVTKDKIADLCRYGFYLASKLVPNNTDNYRALTGYLEYWERMSSFCPAESMLPYFTTLTVYVSKKKDIISWTAKLGSYYPFPDCALSPNRLFTGVGPWVEKLPSTLKQYA